ncbi:MAG: hypothetical protein WC294_00150 [Methanoregula sp.]|jgi:hypothetical protein
MDTIEKTFSKPERNSDAMKSFGFRLKNQFSFNEAYRRPKELTWLEDLRAIKGLYDPDVKIDKNASKVYPKITRSKVNIVLSRLHELLFPDTDRNWEIEPTPEPKMAKEIIKKIAMTLVYQDPATGQTVLPTPEKLRQAIKIYAKTACELMQSEIDDQLIEMDYPEETKKVLRSGLMYGTGVMKGPMISKRQKRLWEPLEDGDYQESVKQEELPFMKHVRLWDWYPDMSVTELDKIEGSFERHCMTKHDIRQLMKRDDFYQDMIAQHLREHPDGDYVPRNWETDLQVIETEAGSGKAGQASASYPTSPLEDAGSTSRQMGKKYQVLEYWGYVDGSDLLACGVNVDDVSLEYAANVWLLGHKPIKTVLYDGALNQYKVFYYEKDETSLMGEGLARVMRHSQLAIAAGARMVLDNGACVAGPQVEVNWSLMTPDTDLNSFYPRKIWYREGKGIDAQYPALRVYNIDSHIDELIKIIELFKSFGDEETTLPTWMIGQMVNNETAQATSGRMATITVSIKDIAKNFDTFTEKVMRDLYAWNMDFNPRTDIKGDYSVKARGVSSLVMKEIRMQSLQQLNTTLTPEQKDYIPEGELVGELFKAHDIKIKLRSDEEVKQIRDARDQSIQNQLALKMLESEIKYKDAQTLSQLTKAKKANTDATIAAQTPIEQPAGTDPRITDGEVALQEAEVAAKEAEIRRKEEQHSLNMQHQQESHGVKVAVDTTTAAHNIANKGKMTEAAIKMKEEAAKIKAKQAKAPKKEKPVKKVK